MCLLYAVAALLILSRLGLLPRIVFFPQKDDGIAPNSVFYYTGNSFTNYILDKDEKRIPVGALDKLDLFSTSNKDQHGYYETTENRFYYYLNNFTYSFKEPKEKGHKEVEYLTTGAIGNTKIMPFDYSIPFGNMFFYLDKSNPVHLYAKGTHSYYSKSFQDTGNTVEELGDILLRNQTEKITLTEFMKVLYYFSDERLIDWNPVTARLVFYCRDGVYEGDKLHFAVYDANTRERQDYYSSAGI